MKKEMLIPVLILTLIISILIPKQTYGEDVKVYNKILLITSQGKLLIDLITGKIDTSTEQESLFLIDPSWDILKERGMNIDSLRKEGCLFHSNLSYHILKDINYITHNYPDDNKIVVRLLDKNNNMLYKKELFTNLSKDVNHVIYLSFDSNLLFLLREDWKQRKSCIDIFLLKEGKKIDTIYRNFHIYYRYKPRFSKNGKLWIYYDPKEKKVLLYDLEKKEACHLPNCNGGIPINHNESIIYKEIYKRRNILDILYRDKPFEYKFFKYNRITNQRENLNIDNVKGFIVEMGISPDGKYLAIIHRMEWNREYRRRYYKMIPRVIIKVYDFEDKKVVVDFDGLEFFENGLGIGDFHIKWIEEEKDDSL
ncbi:MAG: hypothetical protein AB1422_08105 [bacterium]